MHVKILAIGLTLLVATPSIGTPKSEAAKPTGCATLPVEPFNPNSIVGKWLFYKVIYQGSERPPFNPNLILTFDFHPDGSDTLRWERVGERGFCERTGRYEFANNQLADEVIAVHPENNRDCDSDLDMRVGHKTVSKATLTNGDFYLYFNVSDQELIYVFKRVTEEQRSPAKAK